MFRFAFKYFQRHVFKRNKVFTGRKKSRKPFCGLRVMGREAGKSRITRGHNDHGCGDLACLLRGEKASRGEKRRI